MRCVILEIKGRKAALLSDDGAFRAVPDEGYRVGQVLDLTAVKLARLENKARNMADGQGKIIDIGRFIRRHSAVAAAAVVMALAGGTGVAAAYVPVSTVSLESDAAMTLRLNVFDRVLSVRAENEDAREMADTLSGMVRGQKLENAMSAALDIMEEQGRIPEGESDVRVTVESRFNRGERLEERLWQTVEEWNGRRPERAESVNLVFPDRNMGSQMERNGVAPGRDGNPEMGASEIFEGSGRAVNEGGRDASGEMGRPEGNGMMSEESQGRPEGNGVMPEGSLAEPQESRGMSETALGEPGGNVSMPSGGGAAENGAPGGMAPGGGGFSGNAPAPGGPGFSR